MFISNGAEVHRYFLLFFRQKFATGETFEEEGKLKNVNNQTVIVNTGSYTIINDDGSTVLVKYTADESGFHAEVGM